MAEQVVERKGYEELVGLHKYVELYLDAVDEKRMDNQMIYLKLLRKLSRDIEEIIKD